MTDEEVLDLCSKWKNVQWIYIQKNYPEVIEYLNTRYADSKSYIESYYRLKFGIHTRPVCKTCGAEVEYMGGSKFRTYCSKSCVLKDKELCKVKVAKTKATCLKHFGVEVPTRLKSVIDKGRQTNLERYGDPNYNNPEKRRQTNLERYGDPRYNNPDKHKATCLERHGDENYTNREKYKQTCQEKYNCDNTFQVEEFKNKSKETCREKYNSDYFVSSEIGKQRISEAVFAKYGVYKILEVPEVQEKNRYNV